MTRMARSLLVRSPLTVGCGGSITGMTPVTGSPTYAAAEGTAIVAPEVASGRTYVVETRPPMGWGKARVTVEDGYTHSERAW